MSTNGIIARSTGEGTFAGRYHHWDSYPSGLGVALGELYRGYFKRDLDRMLQFLLDEHTGWSTIVHKDFTLKPGYTNVASRPEGMSIEDFHNLPLNRRPQCHCHGARHEEGFVADEKSDCGAEWAYVFETIPAKSADESDQKILHVLIREKHKDSDEYFWQEVGRVDLDGAEEINWTHIECGENFERCGHYAWYHNLQPKTSNLGTQTFLGMQPLDFHDAVAFIVGGKRYAATGSGGNSNFLNQHGKSFPRNTWVASVKAGNGHRIELPVAQLKGDKYIPLENVEWVYPATRTQPRETIVGVKR